MSVTVSMALTAPNIFLLRGSIFFGMAPLILSVQTLEHRLRFWEL
jgi:hypothetical protein